MKKGITGLMLAATMLPLLVYAQAGNIGKIGGQYYFWGTTDCPFLGVKTGEIAAHCLNSAQKPTGAMRMPLSQVQMEVLQEQGIQLLASHDVLNDAAYQVQQVQAANLQEQLRQQQELAAQQKRLERAQLNQSLQAIGQQWQAAGQQALQQSQSWGVPPVQGIPSAGATTTYQQVGNSQIGSDGTTCQAVGQTIICR